MLAHGRFASRVNRLGWALEGIYFIVDRRYPLYSETTAKGTGLEKLAGKGDPVELDSSLAL